MAHISRSWLCPDCDNVNDNAHQCDCGNRLNLINMANTAINKKPVLAETDAILALLGEVGKEKIA